MNFPLSNLSSSKFILSFLKDLEFPSVRTYQSAKQKMLIKNLLHEKKITHLIFDDIQKLKEGKQIVFLLNYSNIFRKKLG
ncbi:hypothetical protein BSK47_03475 [Paenibacillus odorifer]|uniref:IstB-like ATP-binding protein domain-containing protein n=1 Tax=Paenibacillus odorifer TaxID=189426 RepID=A0AB36JNE4_9BACL|nr:hypothetical protein BSK47_03475 [Paenibacillus odorifer]